MSNKLIEALKKEAKRNGIPFKVGNMEFMVTRLSNTEYAKLMRQAESLATQKLRPNRKALQEKKLAAEAITFAKAQFKITDDSISFQSQYDLEKYTEMILIFSDLMLPEILTDRDGMPVYENEQEKALIVEMIKRSPETYAAIQAASEELQKKTLNTATE